MIGFFRTLHVFAWDSNDELAFSDHHFFTWCDSWSGALDARTALAGEVAWNRQHPPAFLAVAERRLNVHARAVLRNARNSV